MRRLTIVLTVLALGGAAPAAKSQQQPLTPWESGVSTIVGIQPLIGGSLAFRMIEFSRVRLAVELSGYLPLGGHSGLMCLNSGAGDCSNGPAAPGARTLTSLGVRATVPLRAQWYALADGALVAGRWRFPHAASVMGPAGGVGIGRESRSARRSIELRWQSLEAPGQRANVFRLGWSHRW